MVKACPWLARVLRGTAVAAVSSALALTFISPQALADRAGETEEPEEQESPPQKATSDLRVATLNANLSGDSVGDLAETLSSPGDEQATELAGLAQQAAPDVLVLTNMDISAGENTAELFATNYLAVGSHQHQGIDYPYMYTSEVNSGRDSGTDLDEDGVIGGPGDALGYGNFDGQRGVIIYSQHPIEEDEVRTFQDQAWADMPDNSIPEDDLTGVEQCMLPLSSSALWDVPLDVDGNTVHLLATLTDHPNYSDISAARAHDEVQFWSDYVSTDESDSEYMTDDDGVVGGIEEQEDFVIAGSLGIDPEDEDANSESINALLEQPRVADPGDDEASSKRTEYVLPSETLATHQSGVLPEEGTKSRSALDFARELFSTEKEEDEDSQQSQLVWVDVVPTP